MKRVLIALAVAAALAACASPGPPGVGAPGQIDLGDWRRASQQRVAARFSNLIARRYAEGSPISQAVADLRANRFACASGEPSARGVAPAQICRRSARDRGCIHTWQVHLFAARQSVVRTRALYDRTCGEDELLGGPA